MPKYLTSQSFDKLGFESHASHAVKGFKTIENDEDIDFSKYAGFVLSFNTTADITVKCTKLLPGSVIHVYSLNQLNSINLVPPTGGNIKVGGLTQGSQVDMTQSPANVTTGFTIACISSTDVAVIGTS